MKLKKFCKIAIIAIGLTVLTACGKKSDPALENYREKMEEFYSSLTYYDQAINALDPEAEDSKEELLYMLDQMNESYKEMASLEVPEEFSGISDLPGEASDYMEKAAEFYHMAYDGDFDEDNEALASQYYERANNRAMVILQVLHGEVPSVEGVSVDE